MRRYWINRVHGLRNFPPNIRCHGGLLPELRSFPPESRTKCGVARVEQVNATCITCRDKGGSLTNRAMAIDAGGGRGIPRFAVEHAVAVDVDIEMAIAALHPVREMHVF